MVLRRIYIFHRWLITLVYLSTCAVCDTYLFGFLDLILWDFTDNTLWILHIWSSQKSKKNQGSYFAYIIYYGNEFDPLCIYLTYCFTLARKKIENMWNCRKVFPTFKLKLRAFRLEREIWMKKNSKSWKSCIIYDI